LLEFVLIKQKQRTILHRLVFLYHITNLDCKYKMTTHARSYMYNIVEAINTSSALCLVKLCPSQQEHIYKPYE